jgi:hypothetical protein
MSSNSLISGTSSSFEFPQPSQYHPSLSQHHHASGDRASLSFHSPKRPVLAVLTPPNSKRTNFNRGIQLEVTPNEDENGSKFPGLYYCNYLPLQDHEHCFCSQVHWRWRQKDGIKLDKVFCWIVQNDMEKSKSSGRKSDGMNLLGVTGCPALGTSFFFVSNKKRQKEGQGTG